jgi:hypothetical protein
MRDAQEQTEEFHEPSDEAFAALALELRRPVLVGDSTSSSAWKELRLTQRALGQAVQRAIGEVVLKVRDMRSAGHSRLAVPAERANEKLGIPLPPECYTGAEIASLGDAVTGSLRASALSEYVYSSVARKLLLGEFSQTKLRALLKGEIAYPVIRSPAIMMRARNWRLRTEQRVANGKIYLDIEIEIAALRPGLGKMTLGCYSLHGRHLDKVKPVLAALQAMELATTGAADGPAKGWSKGALSLRPVRRPGQPEKWQILLPYCAPRVNVVGNAAVVAVHRSVVNMLSAAVLADGKVNVYHYPGKTVVALKNQMYMRRRMVSQDLAAKPHAGRGNRQHYKALARLADAERRATQTELWRAARWVQGIAEKAGAMTVYIDDFTGFDPDQPGPPWEPYVRRWPWSELKLKIIDALTRRAGIAVAEKKSRYISQRCPRCGTVDAANIKQTPIVEGIYVEKGVFFCRNCRFATDPDAVAAENLLTDWGISPPAAKIESR